jgi:nucleoside-diphosphate-sugar epimerase
VSEVDRHFWRGKRVLVTGGTGFLGSHLTRAVAAAGARVTIASRSGPGAIPPPDGAVHMRGDLRDPAFASACTREQDVVLHCASKIAGLAYNARHPAEMMTYNTILDLQVLDAAAHHAVPRFFYPSGALIYDANAPVPVLETASIGGEPLAACQGASWAKRAAEAAMHCHAAEGGMRVVIARLSNVYGPGDDFDRETAHVIANTIRRVAHGEPPEIVGDGSAIRSYLHVTDAVDAVVRLVELAPAGPVNVGGQHEISIRDLVALVIEVSGTALVPRFTAAGPSGLSRKRLDITRLRGLIDFRESTSLRDGLAQTYAWYRRHAGIAGPGDVAPTRDEARA